MPEASRSNTDLSRLDPRARSARSRRTISDIRKQLLEYDNVANDQRREIYQLRNSILEITDVSDQIESLRERRDHDLFRVPRFPEESMEEQWEHSGLETVYAAELGSNCTCRNGWRLSRTSTTTPC